MKADWFPPNKQHLIRCSQPQLDHKLTLIPPSLHKKTESGPTREQIASLRPLWMLSGPSGRTGCRNRPFHVTRLLGAAGWELRLPPDSPRGRLTADLALDDLLKLGHHALHRNPVEHRLEEALHNHALGLGPR